MQGATEVYEYGGLGEHGVQLVGADGETVVGGVEQDGRLGVDRRTILDPGGDQLFAVSSETSLLGTDESCTFYDADDREIGGAQGNFGYASYGARVVDEEGRDVAVARTAGGALGVLLYNFTAGGVTDLTLELDQDRNTVAEITLGNVHLPKRIEIAASDVRRRDLIVAFCFGIPYVRELATPDRSTHTHSGDTGGEV